MDESKFLDARNVAKSLGSVLLGIVCYDIVLAPFFNEGTVVEVWKDKLLHDFPGWVGALAVVAVIWFGIIYFVGRKASKEETL